MRARTAVESPRLAHGPAPYPPPTAPARSSSDRVELPKAHRCRACTAIAWLLTTQPLPDGWHVAIPAGKGEPAYTCPACATEAGLTVAPPMGLPAMGAGELERRWDELHAQVLEWEALADVADGLGRHDLAAARREIAAEIRAERDTMVSL